MELPNKVIFTKQILDIPPLAVAEKTNDEEWYVIKIKNNSNSFDSKSLHRRFIALALIANFAKPEEEPKKELWLNVREEGNENSLFRAFLTLSQEQEHVFLKKLTQFIEESRP